MSHQNETVDELAGVEVLIVDDEPPVRNFIARVLTGNGFRCRSAGDAEEAMAEANRRAPTVTVTDIRMPGRDGVWLLKELKKHWPEMAVIMLTADTDAKKAVECLQNGADYYLVKPIDLDELKISVSGCAEKVRLVRRVHEQERHLEENVKARTARLQEALRAIEATYQDTLEAVLSSRRAGGAADAERSSRGERRSRGERSGGGQSDEWKRAGLESTQAIELSVLRLAGKMTGEGASYLDTAAAVGKELVGDGRLVYARVWEKRGNEDGLEAVVDIGGSALPGVSLTRKAMSTRGTESQEHAGVTSVAAPIIIKGVPECALELGWPGTTGDDARAITERLALVLAAAVAREHDAREWQRTAEELEIFQKLASASRYSLDLEHIAEFLMRSLHRVVDYDAAALLLLDDDPSLSIQARFPMEETFVERVRRHILNTLKLTCGLEAPEGLCLRVAEESSNGGGGPAEPHKLRSFVNVPLSVGGSVVGLIHVSSGKEQAFSEEQVLFVHRAANFLASSVQGVRELLAAVKGRIEQMVEHMTDGVLMLDHRGRVVAMNGAARMALYRGGDEETADAASLAKLLEFDPIALMRSERRSVRRLVCLRGVVYQTQLSPVEDAQGELIGTVLAFRNFEEEKRVDEMKSELVNVVSHELRTPLTAIRNAISLLRGPRLGALTPQQGHFLDLAERNVSQLIDTINDLLDLSKIEAGKMHLELEPVSPAEPLQAALAGLEPQASEKEVALTTSIAPNMPSIFGHAPSLQRVVTNLVGNAIKFTERGGRISVRAVTEEEGVLGSARPAIRVTVEDSGVGIPADQLESIFDKFHQVDGQTRRSALGTGLGLSICRELVKAHHGRIWAESEMGKGSRFSFRIPVFTERELLFEALSSELERAQETDATLVFSLIRIANADELKTRMGESALEAILDELLKVTRGIVRRSSDRVLPHRREGEIAVLLARTTRDGGRAFEMRLLEEIRKSRVMESGAELSLTSVVYSEDGRSAEELYRRALEQIRQTAAA